MRVCTNDVDENAWTKAVMGVMGGLPLVAWELDVPYPGDAFNCV